MCLYLVFVYKCKSQLAVNSSCITLCYKKFNTTLSKYNFIKKSQTLILTVFASGLRIKRTLSLAIDCKTRGGPTKPPNTEESAATNNPHKSNAPAIDI